MRPANGEESTTAKTPHAAMSWTACFDDGCFVHLSDKQWAYFPRQTTRRQPNRKGKKLHWGEPVEEPRIHHEVGTFVVQLQEERLRMANEIGRLKQENREMKKRVVMAEEAVRKAEIEKEDGDTTNWTSRSSSGRLWPRWPSWPNKSTMMPTMLSSWAMSRPTQRTRRELLKLKDKKSRIVGPILEGEGS